MLDVLNLIRAGLIADIGETNFFTLCVLASFGIEDGYIPAKHSEIANRLGVSRQTAGKRINGLMEYYWKDEPIVVKTSHGYKFSDRLLNWATELNTNVNTKDIKSINNIKKQANRITAKTVMMLYATKFKEAYGFEYNFNYTIEGSRIKKLINLYGGEKTLLIVEEAFRKRRMFETPQYPTLTVNQIVTFIARSVMGGITQEAKLDYSDFNEQMRQTDKYKEYFGED